MSMEREATTSNDPHAGGLTESAQTHAVPHGPAPLAQSTISNSYLHAGRDNNLITVEIHNAAPADNILFHLKNILNPVVKAAFDSYSQDQRSSCFENTRVQLLENIEKWITSDSDNQARVYVLDGVAGIGKSTVAQTVAEKAAARGWLVASFFFTKNEEQRATAEHFVPTIAFQLACHSKSFAHHLNEELKNHPDAAQKSIHQQVSLLLLNPLERLSQTWESPIVIVIDALDECREDDAEILLFLLAVNFVHMLHIKIFLTTRPEAHIRSILLDDRNHELFKLHEIEDFIVQADIRHYLRSSLSAGCVRRVFPHRPWQPTTEEIEMLCGICGTLFVIASTATKYILDRKASNPKKRLALLLDGVSPADFSGSKYTNVMDNLYIQIIHSAVPEDPNEIDQWFDQYQLVVGAIVVLRNPLPAQVLANLLGIDLILIEDILFNLHSLVAPTSPHSTFRVHHKSFPDFITNEERIKRALSHLEAHMLHTATSFIINTKACNQKLALACFHIMNKSLNFNIANLPSNVWYKDKADIPCLHSPDLPKHHELIYAVLHWASHLKAGGNLTTELQDELEQWAKEHIITWLEVLAIIGQVNRAPDILEIIIDELNGTEGTPAQSEVHQLLSDAKQFVVQYCEVIKLSSMHIYWSAVPFLPGHSALSSVYKNLYGVRVLAGVDKEWNKVAIATMMGHSKRVKRVTFAPNGSCLASASDDSTVQLWNEKTGVHIASLKGHTEPVNAIAFSPATSTLASGSEDKTIQLWNTRTGIQINTLSGHSSNISAIAFSPDNSRLASGSEDATVQLWNTKTGAHFAALVGHSKMIRAIAFSPDSSTLASGSDDGTVRLWNAKTGVPITTITRDEFRSIVTDVTFSPDGTKLALVNFDSEIQLWNAKTHSYITGLESYSCTTKAILFSPDGSRLVSASYGRNVQLWDGKTGAHIATLTSYSNSYVAFAPDSLIFASSSSNSAVHIWDAKSGAHLTTLSGHSMSVCSLAFSSDSARLASGSFDNTVRLWNAKRVADTSNLADHSGTIFDIAFSPDGSRFASGSDDKTVRIWNGRTGAHITTLTGHSDWTGTVAFSPDGLRIASGSHDKTVQFWDAKTGAHISTLAGHLDYVMAIAYSTNGSRLASGCMDGTIWLWDAETGSFLKTLKRHAKHVTAIAFSPDGSRLASGSGPDNEATVWLWDIETGAHISTFEQPSHVCSITFPFSGSALLVATRVEVGVWDAENNMNAPILKSGLLKGITAMALIPTLVTRNESSSHLPTSSTDDTTLGARLHAGPGGHNHSDLQLILLVERTNPSLTGLVFVKSPLRGDPIIVPFCWFPPQIKAWKLAIDPTGSILSVGCIGGKVILLDISQVPLP